VKHLLAVTIVAAALAIPAAAAGPSTTTRVSVSTAGGQADRDSYAAAISADGRYVVLNSIARNLVPGDTNDTMDVFVHNRGSGQTTRISVSTGGKQGNGSSDSGAMSANGRYIVFASTASNLVEGDTNRVSDVFLHDQASGVTSRVSVSGRGRQANGPSFMPAISADGRYVAFQSFASNLVRGDTNGLTDVFVRDLSTGKTTRVSLTSRGRQARCNISVCESTEAALSAHGRYVAFQSSATNLVQHDTNRLGDVFVRDRRTGKTTRVSVDSRGRQGGGDRTNNGSNAPAISLNGRYVVFHSADSIVSGDTNRVFDIFVHDRRTHRTTRVSVSSSGAQANQESLGAASISSDGRYVAFTSLASNLVAGDANEITDVFIRDLVTGTTTLASLGQRGNQGDDASSATGVAFSANDRYLAFSSWAANLVDGDTNIVADAFVRDFGGRP
jgi:Tol biopolymer transport system component